MKIDGHGFSVQWAWDHTEDEFVKEFKDMDHIFPESGDKVAKLKEAYALLTAKRPKDYRMAKAPKVEAPNDLVKGNVHLLDSKVPAPPVAGVPAKATEAPTAASIAKT